MSTLPYPPSIQAAPIDEPVQQRATDQQQSTVRYAVAAIVLQAGVGEVDQADLTAVATRLADDARRLLQDSAPATPVRAAVALSGTPAATGAGPAGAVGPVETVLAGPFAGRPGAAAPDRPRPDQVLVDRSSRYASVAGRALDLTYREFELLATLVEHPGRVFTREQLLNTAWDHAPVGSRTVDVHVRRLRVKLGPAAGRLTTIRNVGYRFEPTPPLRAGARGDLETVA
jgi:hypothetical protein